MATFSETTSGPCECCSSVSVGGCCPGDTPIVIPGILTVTLNTPGPWSVACTCPTGDAFTDAYAPLGGDGTTFTIAYDSGLMQWVGSYTACDGTTVNVTGTATGPDGFGHCHFQLQALNPLVVDPPGAVSWFLVIPAESPTSDMCAGLPPCITGTGTTWLRHFGAGGFAVCDLTASITSGCGGGGGGGGGSEEDMPLIPTSTKTANYSAAVQDLVVCDTSGGAFTVTLPGSPAAGDKVGVLLKTAGSNLTVARNGHNIDGAASDLTLSVAGTVQAVRFNGTEWQTAEAAGQVTLGSPFSLTSTGTYQNTGLNVVVPVPGFYGFKYNARGDIQVSGGDGWIQLRLYDATAGAAVPDSDRLIWYSDSTDAHLRQVHSAYSLQYFVPTAGSTVRLEAMRQTGTPPTWSLSQIDSDSAGKTQLSYERLV